MTTYLAAYDTENVDTCLPALPRIVEMHEKHAMPATFFIATHLLPRHSAALKALLDRPLFEIASHSHEHELLATHSRSVNPPIDAAKLPDEVLGSKQRLEDLFGRAVTGFRPPWGYGEGLRHAPRLLELLDQGGYRYVSSVLWGENDTLPAPIQPAFTYAAQGYPRLWEIPSCGWHENVLKKAVVMLKDVSAPVAPFPGAIPPGPIATPEEEFALNRLFIDRAVEVGNPYVTLVWHPWSLGGFDPEMRMLDQTFAYVRERGLPASTFGAYAGTLSA